MVKLKSLPSVYFVAHLINHLSTVSIGSLYESGSKAIRYKSEKPAFQDNES